MGYKLLLADDSEDYREEFKAYFSQYDIVEASNGREALEVLARPNDIDLVVLDVVMPGMDGLETLRRMKNSRPGLGVIMLTSRSSEETAIQALKARADDYARKDTDIRELSDVIENVLRETGVEGYADATTPEAKVRKVQRFIERNYDKMVTLGDAAKLVSLSPKYLSRIFKRHAGHSFSEHRIRVKIDKAKGLLSSSGLNVSEISDTLGYENPESFMRIFQKYTGYTPSDHRKTSAG